MIQGTEDTRYAYTNGVVRAKESRFLKKSHFDRLIASELSSFNAILTDTPYTGQEDFLTIIELTKTQERDFFNNHCETLVVKKFIDWPLQLHNLRVKLKGGSDELLYPQGLSEVESWPEVIDEVARWTTDKDPFILSSNLDKVLCKYLFITAQSMPFFREYFKIYFDLENIRSFFRSRQFKNSREIFNQVYISYGGVKKELFIENLDAHHDLLGKNFYNTPYATILDMGGAYLETGRSFLRLERLCEELSLNFLSQARRMTFGVEPLFGYFHFKMSEIKKLRQIYIGKLNAISEPELRESIADVW